MRVIRSIERKLVKHGNSVHVSLPMSELRDFNLNVGDQVSIITTDEGLLIQPIRKIEMPSHLNISPDFFKEMDEIIKEHDGTFKGLVDQ
ncbi:AbrB/MazE/SpoVT family DNA-binding domain-containing protein [Exiguobacterium sp. s37]|uniref:AbrB/MazE/SpoVT family DNA-binding domain-containing protein n=1 Tax=Exiguobacterium sp. s37 TaxID=2751275 RepID=UPI001BE5C0DE|nr:AbrB/MazE/SpoVT family DNA-binding domain-containing protein [Exiguobacterium sp. s37]